MTATTAALAIPRMPDAPDGAPRFRDDLEVVAEDRIGVAPRYIVRDPRSDRVFVLAEELHFVCRALDGRTSRAEIAARYRARFGKELARADLDALIRQLAGDGLLEATPDRRTLPERLDGPPPHVDVRLAYVDPVMTALARSTRALFTPLGKLAVGATVATAIAMLVTSWSTYTAAASNGALAHCLVPILIYVLLGGAVRLAGQGIALKRQDIQLLDLKLTLTYWVVPMLVTENDPWMLVREKYERMRCIATGIAAQVLTWAIATLAWRVSTPGSTQNTAFLAVSVGMCAGTLLLSLNPLLQSDGYFLLTIWLDAGRLRTRALRAFGDWLYRRPSREPVRAWERGWLTVYGGLCSLYYVAVRAAIVWMVGRTFASGGAGAFFAVGVGIVMFEPQLVSYVEDVPATHAVRVWWSRLPRFGRWVGVALGALLIALIPYPYEIGGPMVLLPQHYTEISAEVEGLVSRVLVHEGQRVEAGESIAEISPREYEVELQATRKQLVTKQAELDILRLGAKPEVIARANLEVQKGEEELRRAEQQVEALTVRLRYSSSQAQRYKNMYGEDAISRQEYENAFREREMAQEQLDVAKAQVVVARTAVDIARADLATVTSPPRDENVRGVEAEVERLKIIIGGLEEQVRLTVLRSPVAGRISTAHVEEKAGHYLRKGEIFAVIEQSNTIEAEVQVPEEDAGEIRSDARVKIVTWTYPDRTFYGRALFVAPIAATTTPDAYSRSVRVVTQIPNDDALLKAAMTGYAKIKAPWRPMWKVFFWPPLRWVFVQVWYWLP
jgi:putative peptide zinc metalloprotease protein